MKHAKTPTQIGDPKCAVATVPTSPTTMRSNPATIGTRTPNRLAMVPLTMLPTTAKRADGRNTRPASSGGSWSCCWRNRLRTNTVPKLLTMNANPTARAMRIPLDRNRANGIIGCALLAWITRKPTMPTSATPRLATTTGLPNPSAPPSMSPNTSAVDAMSQTNCPAQSNGSGRDGDDATVRSRRSIMMQTGRLIANTSRQSSVVNAPPRTGPSAVATAPPTAQTPRARARSRPPGNASRMSAMDAGSINAAPAPCRARAVMRTPIDGATAHAIDVTRKTATPTPNAGFAPNRSERLPARSRRAANSTV
nr:hypothetical protein [Plantibacter sp. VKM Ac-2885]